MKTPIYSESVVTNSQQKHVKMDIKKSMVILASGTKKPHK